MLYLGSLYFINWPGPFKEDSSLELQVTDLELQINDQRKTIIAYQRALIGEERDLLSMYDSVQEAKQVDLVVHADNESGLPIKFILDCGGIKQ